MKRVLTAVVLIPVVLLLTFKAPLWLFALLVLIVAMVALREYLEIIKGYGVEPLAVTSYILLPMYFAVVTGAAGRAPEFGLISPWVIVPVALIYALVGLRRDMKIALPSVSLSLAGFMYVGVTLSFLILMRALFAPLGAFFLFYLFVVVWSGDIFAYYVGTTIGRHKLAPEVSPKKTWEGAVASVVGAGILGALILAYKAVLLNWIQPIGPAEKLKPELIGPSVTLLKAFVCSALINVAAQFGDLVESMMKRGAGVKDSGAILPGHGGMLDRVDALLFAAPVGFVIILLAIHS